MHQTENLVGILRVEDTSEIGYHNSGESTAYEILNQDRL